MTSLNIDEIRKLAGQAEALRKRVADLEEALYTHSIGTSYRDDGTPLRRHCFLCNTVWSAADTDEHHAEDCIIRHAPTRPYTEGVE
jgi:hypothetical protein